MSKLILISGVLFCSLTSVAQVQFDQLIETSIAQQNTSAVDIQKSTQITLAEDDSFDTKSAVNMVPTPSPVAATPAEVTETPAQATPEASAGTTVTTPAAMPNARSASAVADDKDFNVKLRPTGKETAQRYFKVAYETERVQIAKERAERKAALKAKKEKLRAAKLEKKEKARLAKQARSQQKQARLPGKQAQSAKLAKSKKIKKSSRATASVAAHKKARKKASRMNTAQNEARP